MNSFEEMPVWKKAMDIAVAVHAITATLPRCEDYGLTSQMRRSALSISDNIAEGFGREHTKDKCMFYIIARGSAQELKSQLIYGTRVNYFNQENSTQKINSLDQIILELNALLKSFR